MLKQTRTKKLKQRLHDRHAISALREAAKSFKQSPLTSLHSPGHIPFWMRPEARGARTGQGESQQITPEQTVRILQDTGHDIWLFLSNRGLEIRSFYLFPKAFSVLPNSGNRIPTQGRHRQHSALKKDVIIWDELFGDLILSAHKRLEIIRLQNSLPSPEEAEQRARIGEPLCFAQVQPGQLKLNVQPIPITIKYDEDRSTAIFPDIPEQAGAYGYLYFGRFLFSTKANLIRRVLKTLTWKERACLFAERRLSGVLKPTPFPSSDIFQIHSD